MRLRRLAAVLMLIAMAGTARIAMAQVAPLSCLDAAVVAEAEWSLPKGLLAAIGRVESGQLNPGTRRIEPWPWIINLAGADRIYSSAREAIADVTRERAGGTRSMDVGCFQINLFYHPDAFATLEDAFDPLANARYAARFLTSLRADSGSWDLAVARYHSGVPGLGEPYRQRVMASWEGGETLAAFRPGTPYVVAASAIPATRPARGFVAPVADPHVIRVAATMFVGSMTARSPQDPHVIRIRG